MGQDVADFGQSELEKLENKDLKGKGGVFKISSGLQRCSLKGQVFDSPLAEANIIGRAIAQAARGIKPWLRCNFLIISGPLICNSKTRWLLYVTGSGGDFKCPMVVRVPIGGYLRGGSIYHSQCGESLFTHIPGIRVAYPSSAIDSGRAFKNSD